MKFLQLLFLAGALASATNASIIYDDITEVSAGDDGVDFAGPLDDSFTSGAAGQITGLQLILSGDDTSHGAVEVGLFADHSAAPGNLIAAVGSVSDSALSIAPAVYNIALIAYPPLAADTRYWIGLSGTTTANWFYIADSSGIGVTGELFSNQMGIFTNDNGPYQVSVTEGVSSAPEPSSLVLIAVGAGLLAVARLRRSRISRLPY